MSVVGDGTRVRILEAACDRIASDGIDAVRIARIARDAGVSTSLVHYHFETREALLGEALVHSFARAGDARIREEAANPRPPANHRERLAQMIDDCLPLPRLQLERDWVLWVELWLRAVRHPDLRPVAAELYARMRAWFGEAIEAGVRDGEFPRCDSGVVADRLLAAIDGFGVRALLGDPAVPVERAQREIGALLDGELGMRDTRLDASGTFAE